MHVQYIPKYRLPNIGIQMLSIWHCILADSSHILMATYPEYTAGMIKDIPNSIESNQTSLTDTLREVKRSFIDAETTVDSQLVSSFQTR